MRKVPSTIGLIRGAGGPFDARFELQIDARGLMVQCNQLRPGGGLQPERDL
jgi:hypothetical protein